MSQLSFEQFIKTLEEELEYHRNGGTPYRQETAKLSIEVANAIKEADAFLDPSFAKQAVISQFPSLEEDRKKDIAKMMYIIAKDIHIKQNISDDVKRYVQEKMQKGKLSLSKNPN